MKLRQKLAVALATAMVITSVPVVTMAASTNTISKVVTVGSEQTLGEAAPVLKIVLKDAVTSGTQFYLTLENSEWANVGTEVSIQDGEQEIAKLKPSSKTEATVTLLEDLEENDTLLIKLEGVKVKGEAKISIEADGTEITSTTTPLVFANVSTANATVTAKDAKTFYTTDRLGNEVGTIVITEQVAGSLASASEADRTIEIDLEHSDFEFVSPGDVQITGTKGFSSFEITSANATLDNGTLVIVLPQISSATAKGAFEITGIKVKSTDNAPETGDLNVAVSGKKVENQKVAVAKVTEYGTTLTVEKKKEVVAGESTEVKFTLKENTTDSISTGDVEFTLTEGVMFTEPTIKHMSGTTSTDIEDIVMVPKDKKDLTKGYTGCIVRFASDANVNALVVEAEIFTDVNTKGEIAVEAEGRFIESQSVVVAEVTSNFAVETEAMTLKVGQSKQVGGQLVITEAKEGTFKRGTEFEIKVAKEDGITLTKLPKVEATNGMAVEAEWKEDSVSTTSATVVVRVTKTSKNEAAEITVKDFEVKTDRTVPEGSYDLELKVGDLRGTVEVKDFLVVGTPNTEDLAANGLAKGTSSFVIGQSKYTVNGVEKTMDAASYIQDPGYTMVPVRYVAEAFGVKANDILFSNGTATIFAGNRTIQLTNNSDVAIVNGASIKMATKVVIKEGRTYAPIGEVAKLLGIDKAWDSTSKTATFINK